MAHDLVGFITERLSVPVHLVFDLRIIVAFEGFSQNASRFAFSF
jgi:hypothetical protein